MSTVIPSRAFSVAGDLNAEPVEEAWKPPTTPSWNDNSDTDSAVPTSRQQRVPRRQRRGERGTRQDREGLGDGCSTISEENTFGAALLSTEMAPNSDERGTGSVETTTKEVFSPGAIGWVSSGSDSKPSEEGEEHNANDTASEVNEAARESGGNGSSPELDINAPTPGCPPVASSPPLLQTPTNLAFPPPVYTSMSDNAAKKPPELKPPPLLLASGSASGTFMEEGLELDCQMSGTDMTINSSIAHSKTQDPLSPGSFSEDNDSKKPGFTWVQGRAPGHRPVWDNSTSNTNSVGRRPTSQSENAPTIPPTLRQQQQERDPRSSAPPRPTGPNTTTDGDNTEEGNSSRQHSRYWIPVRQSSMDAMMESFRATVVAVFRHRDSVGAEQQLHQPGSAAGGDWSFSRLSGRLSAVFLPSATLISSSRPSSRFSAFSMTSVDQSLQGEHDDHEEEEEENSRAGGLQRQRRQIDESLHDDVPPELERWSDKIEASFDDDDDSGDIVRPLSPPPLLARFSSGMRAPLAHVEPFDAKEQVLGEAASIVLKVEESS